MANHQIDMRKIKTLFRLHTEGVSKRKISIQLGLSRNTVTKYINFFNSYKITSYEVNSMTVEELSALFRTTERTKSDQQKTLEEYFPYFDRELKKTGVTKELLWNEYKERHPDGYMLSQFRHWYTEWCKAVSPVMHFNHKAGDKLFIDFTGKKLSIVDEHTGEVQFLEVLICTLGSSQYTYAEACPSQKKEDFIRCIENALWYFGGVPKALVPDNLKAAVTKSSRYEPKVNETFADFAEHYQTSVLPTRAYKPRDKAIVENAVRIIYTRVFAPLRNKVYHQLDELNEAILDQLDIHNGMSFRGRTYSRKSLFIEVEKDVLGALPQARYELKQSSKATVHKNSHVYLNKDKHYYSVPYKFISKKVKLIYSESTIEVYYKLQKIASHQRNGRKYSYTTDKDHMPSHHRFVAEWSPTRFISWAEQIGADCKVFITKILDKRQHPEQSYKSCMGVLHLAKKVGNERLNNACKRALDYQAYNYKMIESILEKGWDNIQDEDQDQNITHIPPHKNIRGRNYYK